MAADSIKPIAEMVVGQYWARLRSLGVDDMTTARLQYAPPTDLTRQQVNDKMQAALRRLQAMPCPTEAIQ